MGSRWISGKFSIPVIVVASLFLVAGCEVDPKFADQSVACEADADCEQLPLAVFECDTDAGLCVRVGELCNPPCPDSLRCVNGSCEIKLEIDEPAKGAFVGESFLMKGTALWLENGAELVVQCKHGDTYEDADSVISGAPNQEGLIRSEWECELRGEGGVINVYVRAHAGSSKGARGWTLKQDVQAPEADVQVLLEDGREGTVYKPQEVSVHIEAVDYLGPETVEEPNGEVRQLRVKLYDPRDELILDEILEGEECEGIGGPAASCELEFELFSDLMADELGQSRALHGRYSVQVIALDAVGNVGIGEGHFEVDREPRVAIWLRDLDSEESGSPDSEAITVKRDGSFEILVKVEKLQQMAKDDDETIIAPLLKIGNPVLGSSEHHWREIQLELAASNEDEVGRWNALLDATFLDLFAVEQEYPVAAVIEDVWSHDPGTPREPSSLGCPDAADTVLIGASCSKLRITRKKWEPVNLCADQGDTCQVLTPALDERGGVFVGINFGQIDARTHRLLRIDSETGEQVAVWSPEQITERRHLLDGPIAHGIDGHTQVYLLIFGRLVAVNGYPAETQLPWSSPWSTPLHIDGIPSPPSGLPGIGGDHRLYIPILYGLNIEETSNGNVLVLNREGALLRRVDLEAKTPVPVNLGVRRGVDEDWAALFGAGETFGTDSQGGRIRCEPDELGDVSCSDNRNSTRYDAFTGHLATLSSGYLAAFRGSPTTTGGSLDFYGWGTAGSFDVPIAEISIDSISTGPVYRELTNGESLDVVVGTDAGLAFVRFVESDGNTRFGTTSFAEGLGPVQGVSLDNAGRVYALISSDSSMVSVDPEHLKAGGSPGEPEDGHADILWRIDDLGDLHDKVVPVLAPNFKDGAVHEGTGVLYLAAGGKIRALITDDPPAVGWPNARGCKGGQAASGPDLPAAD